MNNKFTKDQLDHLYSNKEFIKFINQYFGNLETTIFDINLETTNIKDEENDIIADIEIYLRVFLANIEKLRDLLNKVENEISYVYKQVDKNIKGEIKGTLRLNDYIRLKGIQTIPKTYPCKVKDKSFNTVENIYLMFIVKKYIKKLHKVSKKIKKKIGNKEFTEMKLIDKHLNYFKSFKWKAYFREPLIEANNLEDTYKNRFPRHIRNRIKVRIKKRQIRNYYFYKKVFKLYESFFNRNIIFSDKKTLKTLSYNESFSDKLFELWLLYRIISTFKHDYGFNVIKENHLVERRNTYICKFKTNNDRYLRIYFQKGKDLFWDDRIQTRWEYIKEKENNNQLTGIPDIVVKYGDKDKSKVVLLDAKNRIRSKGRNSEEIYKMLGYYENFRDFLNNRYSNKYKFYSALLFRNDKKGFEEKLKTDNGDKIIGLSFSPQNNYELNEKQFHILCKFILDVCGKEGNAAEVIGDYKNKVNDTKGKLKNAIKNNDEEEIENIVRKISEDNHLKLMDVFKNPELQEKLDTTKEKLKRDHFPHVWDEMNSVTRRMLSMAESLFDDMEEHTSADYAPICLEYCRAFENELNKSIFNPFKEKFNIDHLVSKSNNYKRLKKDRELSLGECIYILNKWNCSTSNTLELKEFVIENFTGTEDLFKKLITIGRIINKDYRRKAAHTSIMSYDKLEKCRQRILGIGISNIFYILLDNR